MPKTMPNATVPLVKLAGIALVLALAGCGGSSSSGAPAGAGHDVHEFASVVAQAKVDIESLQAEFEQQPSAGGFAESMAVAQRDNAQLVARLVKLEGELRAVGRPDHAAATIVPATLTRLAKIAAAGAAWTSCKPPESTVCRDPADAFSAAFKDVPRIWASWQPYLG